MKKRIPWEKADKRGPIGNGAGSRPGLSNPRIRGASSCRSDLRNIKRFFRNQSFQQRAVKKRPTEKTRPVLKLGDLITFFEKARKQVNDQIKEYKVIYRNRRADNRK
jgi:hypothetical protein